MVALPLHSLIFHFSDPLKKKKLEIEYEQLKMKHSGIFSFFSYSKSGTAI